jgi:hypothetical protein
VRRGWPLRGRGRRRLGCSLSPHAWGPARQWRPAVGSHLAATVFTAAASRRGLREPGGALGAEACGEASGGELVAWARSGLGRPDLGPDGPAIRRRLGLGASLGPLPCAGGCLGRTTGVLRGATAISTEGHGCCAHGCQYPDTYLSILRFYDTTVVNRYVS